jgi:hypothetical protein
MNGGQALSETDTRWEYKEISVPLDRRKGMLTREATFQRNIMEVIEDAVRRESAAGWEPAEPMDYKALRRGGRIHWKTAFSLNPLGDMNKAVSASIRLKRRRG